MSHLVSKYKSKGQKVLGKDGKPFLISPDDEWEVTNDKLQHLFEDVKDMPVAIYSISGPFRKGKSFMLNLFIKYLEKMEKELPGRFWWDVASNDLEGFSWKGGMERDTQGILIYSKPFVIKDEQGRKVAVFLMDTQGLFNPETSVTEMSRIFALSTLISSMQIYNLSQQIQEDHLQYLQLFTEYGRALQKNASLSKSEKPFQNLLFLVRDWPHQSRHYGFEEGKKVLEKTLAVKENASEDLTSVRKHINDSFETVQCFLMPHPGSEIANRTDGVQKFEPLKLDVIFKIYLGYLERDLFSPENLALKQIGGRQATGQDMINHILGLMNSFKSNFAPHIGTVLQSAAEQVASNTLDHCERYCQLRWYILEDPNVYLEDDEIDSKRKEIEAEVFDYFHDRVLLGGESFKDGLQKKMKNRINQQMLLFKHENQQLMEEQIKMNERQVEIATQEFKDKLKRQTLKVEFFKHEQLKKIGAKIESDVLNKFQPNQTAGMKEKYRKRVKENIRLHILEVSHTNLLQQLNIKQIMKRLVLQCFRQFKDEMPQQEIHDTDRNTFTTKLETAEKSAFGKFDEESKEFDKNFCGRYRNELQRCIKEYSDLYKAKFEAKKEEKRIKFDEIMKKAQNEYRKVEKLELKKYLSDEELEAFHAKCSKAAEDFLLTCLEWNKDSEEKELVKSELIVFFENQWRFLQHKNKDLKSQVILEMKQCVVEITKAYSSKMVQELVNETNQNEHDKKHKKALDEALAEFDKLVKKIQHLDAQKDQNREKLREEIVRQFEHNSLQLMRQQETFEKEVSNLIDKCLLTYTRYMSKKLQKAISDDDFDDLHEYASERAQQQLNDSQLLKANNLKEKKRAELVELIDQNKLQMLETNKNKQAMGKHLAGDHLLESSQFYHTKMQQICSRGYVDICQLMEEHHRTRDSALDDFKSKASGQQLYQFKDFQGDLSKTIESEWKTLCAKNENHKKLAEHKIKERATKLLSSFGKQVHEKLQKHLPNDEFSVFCDGLKEQLLQEFIKSQPEDLQEFFLTEQESLEKNLQSDYSHVVKVNNQNMEELIIKLKKSKHVAKSNFEEAFKSIFHQYLENEELEKLLAKEYQGIFAVFDASVSGIQEIFVEPVRSKLEKNIQRTVERVKDENLKNKEIMEKNAKLANTNAIMHMKFEYMKILHDQVDIATARYRASDAVIEAMEIFETYVVNLRKFGSYKETKSALFRLKEEVIDEVRNKKKSTERCLQEVKELTIEYVMDEVEKIDMKQTNVQDAEKIMTEVVSEAMTKYRNHLQDHDTKYDALEFENTKQEIKKIQKQTLMEVKKKTDERLTQKAKELATEHVNNEVAKIDMKQTNVQDAEKIMTEVVSEAMTKYRNHLQDHDTKYDALEFENTKREINEIKKRTLDKVKEERDRRCIQDAKKLAIRHVNNEVSKIDLKQITTEDAERKVNKAISQAKLNFQEYLQTHDVEFNQQEYETNTYQDLKDIKKEFRKIQQEKKQRVAAFIAELKTKYAAKVSSAVYDKWLPGAKMKELNWWHEYLVKEYTKTLQAESKDESDRLRLMEALEEERNMCCQKI